MTPGTAQTVVLATIGRNNHNADLPATRGERGKNTMSERELERILAEEADEEKVWRAMEEYLKGGD